MCGRRPARGGCARERARRLRLAAGGSLGALALAAAVAASAFAQPAIKRPLLTIQARIRVYATPGIPTTSQMAPRAVTFSPDLVNVGTVIIEIRNTDDEPHSLQIGGATSSLIGPGGRAFMRVTFRHAGVYPVSVSTDTPVPIGGSVRVVK